MQWRVGLALMGWACSGDGPEAKDTVEVRNEAPVAVDDAASARSGTPVRLEPVLNDTDADGDDLEVITVAEPSGGVAVIEEGGSVLYTPDVDFAGADRFAYTISDGNGGEATANILVEVLPHPRLTVTSPEPGVDRAAGPVTVDFAVEGCGLGDPGPLGCRVVGTLDDVPLDPFTTTSLTVTTDVNGEHEVALELLQPDGEPFVPGVVADTRWFTTGGATVGAFEGDRTFSSRDEMEAFCQSGFTTVTGSVRLTSETDAMDDALDCLTYVQGDLVIEDTSLEAIALPNLDRVDGTLALLNNARLNTSDLSDLDQVGSLVVEGNGALAAVRLPSLVRTTGDLRFVDNLGLELAGVGIEELGLPSLREIGGAFLLADARALPNLELPRLERVHGAFEVENGRFGQLSAPALVDAQSLQLRDTHGEISLPSLETVGGFVLGGCEIDELDLPALETIDGVLKVESDDRLRAIRAPLLRRFDRLELDFLPDLETLGLPALEEAEVLAIRYTGLSEARFDLSELVTVDIEGSFQAIELPQLRLVEDLTLTMTGPSLDLGSLETATHVQISARDLELAELPSLRTVDGDLLLGLRDTRTLAIPELRTAGLVSIDSEALTAFAAPELTSVGGMVIQGGPSLITIELPVLQSAGVRFVIRDAGSSGLFLPQLASVGSFEVIRLNQLATLSLPQLTEADLRVNGSERVANLDVRRLARGSLELLETNLTDLSLSGIESLSVRVQQNRNLRTVFLQGETLTDLQLVSNGRLRDVQLDVDTLGGMWLTGNGELLTFGATTTTLGDAAGFTSAVTIAGSPRLESVDFSQLVTGSGYVLEIVGATDLTDLDLGALESIGQVEVVASGITTLDLGSLTTCDASCLQFDHTQLEEVDLSGLVSAFSLDFDETPLRTIDLPSLTTITDDLLITDNDALTSVNLPSLESVGDRFFVEGNPGVVALSLPALTSARWLSFFDNDALEQLSIPTLPTAVSLTISNHERLETFDLTSLVTLGPSAWEPEGDLSISDNLALLDLDGLSALVSVADDLAVQRNPALPTADAEAFAAGVTVGDLVTVTDNGP